MKVIVTGSEGFIGKSLCQRLDRSGAEIVRVDRKLGLEASDIGLLMDGADCVFHLAAQTSVFNNDRIQIRMDNIDSFMAVADACAERGGEADLCQQLHGEREEHDINVRCEQAVRRAVRKRVLPERHRLPIP